MPVAVKITFRGVDDVRRMLVEAKGRVRAGIDAAMTEIVLAAVRRAQGRLSGEVLHVRSNVLRSSVALPIGSGSGSGVRRQGAVTMGVVGTGVIYGRAHELGAVIRPKTKRYLRFKTADGQWHTVRRVVLPKRPWLKPSVDEAVATGNAVFDKHLRAALRIPGR